MLTGVCVSLLLAVAVPIALGQQASLNNFFDTGV